MKRKEKRASRIDVIAATAMQDHCDLSSQDVIRRRTVIIMEVEAAEQEIVELTARLADARARRNRGEAKLNGIGMVLAAR